MENISPALLHWFHANHRILPFRSDPTPYHVWLSEIMLQQTRVSAALPYYERFLAALPDIPALAACEEEKLHKLWEGLGYYSRVRNLQKAAKLVCAQYGGELPADYDALRALPGIGDYTAGAIASISFGLPVPAVDGNVLRVFSRLYNDDRLITDPKVKRAFTARVMEHQPPAAPGDYNQALMELGALVCVPRSPACGECPLAAMCLAHKNGEEGYFPVMPEKKPKKEENIYAFVIMTPRGIAYRKREKGVLRGMNEFPSETLNLDDGADENATAARILETWGVSGAKILKKHRYAHIFTHVKWNVTAFTVTADEAPFPAASEAELREKEAFPTAFRRCLDYFDDFRGA